MPTAIEAGIASCSIPRAHPASLLSHWSQAHWLHSCTKVLPESLSGSLLPPP